MTTPSNNSFEVLSPPDALTRPFWEGCERAELLVQECDACHKRFFTPLPACPACLSTSWTWVRSPGTGELYSFSVVSRAVNPSFPAPYVLAIVDLDDGWTMMTNLVDCDISAISCGQKVEVRFRPDHTGRTLPFFAPV